MRDFRSVLAFSVLLISPPCLFAADEPNNHFVVAFVFPRQHAFDGIPIDRNVFIVVVYWGHDSQFDLGVRRLIAQDIYKFTYTHGCGPFSEVSRSLILV